MSELVVLPPHLIDRIRAILAVDLDLPENLRIELQDGLKQTSPRSQSVAEGDDGDGEPPRPPTLDVNVLERLSRWVGSDDHESDIRRTGLEYGMIALLAGTELYFPPNQLPLPPSSPINPYLPSYLSPLPPSFGQEYRSLARQLSTVLNILFSIFGSAFAVYVAATTGGGYSREKGVLLGVVAGLVVGVADGVLIWIFQNRVKEGREEGRKMAIKLSRGSGADGEKVDHEGNENRMASEDGEDVHGGVGEAKETPIVKREIRLRRRAIPEKSLR